LGLPVGEKGSNSQILKSDTTRWDFAGDVVALKVLAAGAGQVYVAEAP